MSSELIDYEFPIIIANGEGGMGHSALLNMFSIRLLFS